MEIQFNKYIVNSEVDFVDNGVDKIRTSISLIVDVVGKATPTKWLYLLRLLT